MEMLRKKTPRAGVLWIVILSAGVLVLLLLYFL